jgi:hypothetical protein
MSEGRPKLEKRLGASEFLAWYWLKEELVRFCRGEGLPAAGAKRELSARIEAYLSGEALPPPGKAIRKATPMPERFELATMIGVGWRCSQGLRGFFEEHCGGGFHFNEALRRFIATGSGRTLAEAVALYRESTGPGRDRAGRCHERREIGEQFEYNRHFREYFLAHPDATREEAVAAWKRKREERRE